MSLPDPSKLLFLQNLSDGGLEQDGAHGVRAKARITRRVNHPFPFANDIESSLG